MKVIKQLRDIHRDAIEKYTRLSNEVRDILKGRVEQNGWFFLSRIKEIESFALKIETGRVPDPYKLEDFFACTIVVPTIHQIQLAEEMVLSFYKLNSRRPPEDSLTHKASSSFAFDDLRLYVERQATTTGKDEDLNGLIFEVQVKTILQHAWSVATHDLIYKSNSVSWPRERIAFQVKAMLEHAEVAIAEADRISDAKAVAKKDEQTTNVLKIIEQIETFWPKDRLPANIKRLAESTWALLKAADRQATDLQSILDGEKRRVGMLPTSLSPYAFTVQALAHTDNFQEKFSRTFIKTKIVIHPEMELPAWMLQGHSRIIRLG